MEKNEVIKRIREYHIIRDILKDKAIKAHEKDPKYAGIIAVYQSYADFFGSIRIDAFEDFDRMFRRLENNYLADGKKTKVQPSEDGYSTYLRDVIGKNIDIITEVFDKEENIERIRSLSFDVGGKTRESNAVVVARALKAETKLSNALMNYHESVRAGAKKDEKIEELRRLCKISDKIAHTEEAVLGEISNMQAALLSQMLLYANENKDLLKTVSGLVETKTTELGVKIDGIDGKIDVLSDKIDKSGKKLNFWKGAGLVTAGATGLALVNLGLAALGIFPTATIENQGNATAVDSSSHYTAFIDDSQNLNAILNGLIADGKLTLDEKNGFIGAENTPVAEYLAKYASTDLKDRSESFANGVTTMANGVYSMTGAQEVLSGYNTDVATLNNALNGIVIDGVTADEKTTFVDGNVAEFLNKYAETELKSASELQAEGFTKLVESYYGLANNNGVLEGTNADLTAVNALISAYNSDVASLNTTLGNLLASDAVLTLDEKESFVNTDVANFVAEYAETSLASASEAQAEGFKKVIDNAYGYSAAQVLLSGYNADVAALDATLYNYLTDALYTADEKVEYDAVVDAFVKKYEDTTLKEVSAADAQTMKNISNNISTMSDDKQKALADLAKVNSDYAVLEGKFNVLKEENAKAIAANAELASKVEELTLQISTLSDKIEELKGMLSSTDNSKEQELLVKIGKLESDLAKANSDYAELEGKFAELEATNAGLVEQIKTLTTENASLKEELDEAKTMLQEIKDEKAELLTQLQAKEITIEEYASRIAELEASEDALQTTVASLESQITDKDAQISDLTNQVSEKDALVEYYKGEVENLTAENADLQVQLNEANTLISDANDTIAALQLEKAALEEDLKNNYITKAEYDAKLAELAEVEQGLRNEIAELTQNIGKISAELEAKKQEYNELLEKYNALETKDAETEQALADAKAEIIALEEQLSKSSVEAATLVFDIYEYITGSTTTDINLAMQVISEQLGITTVPPSSEAGSNVKQPGM